MQAIYLVTKTTIPWSLALSLMEIELTQEMIDTAKALSGTKTAEQITSLAVPLNRVSDLPGMPGKMFIHGSYIAKQIGLSDEEAQVFVYLVCELSKIVVRIIQRQAPVFEVKFEVKDDGSYLLYERAYDGAVPDKKEYLN